MSALSSPGRSVYWNVEFFLGALPYVQLYNKIGVATVSSWAWNGQKGEKLSLFDHLCPRVTFDVPLYKMTQLWCEWSHWFDFWLACRPLAPAFSDVEHFGTEVNSLVAKWRITGKKARNFDIGWFQLWAALGEVFIEMWNFVLVHFPMSSYTTRSRVATVSSWASNGHKGEKLSLFAHLCPRVTFNIPLYNMTQLWCEWSHWFDFWFAL